MLSRRKFIGQSSLTGLGLGLRLGTVSHWPAQDEEEFGYRSPFIRVRMDAAAPRLTYFSTDSLGQGQFAVSPLLPVQDIPASGRYRSEKRRDAIAYYQTSGSPGGAGREDSTILRAAAGVDRIPGKMVAAWEFRYAEKRIEIRTRWSQGLPAESFPIAFSQKLNHCTVLGKPAAKNKLKFPCVLHLPGMGSFRIYCSDPAIMLDYDAYRFSFGAEKGEPFVSVLFTGAGKEHPDITYTLESVAIAPELPRHSPGRSDGQPDARFDGYRRNYINIFQLNPRTQVLANNSASDACAFTLFLYAEMARKTPPLVTGLSAMDLIRHTLDRYLSGWKGYGQVGYDTPAGWHSQYDSCDSGPSLIISACYYIVDTNDTAWGSNNYAGVLAWAEKMMATDSNGDGIIEYGYSGNTGSWEGAMKRPANWWDTIGFGHDDAYSNALAYHALRLLASVAGMLGHHDDQDRLHHFAARLKESYYAHFFNPESGLLAGWKSEDGQLHDYSFTFVNSVAVCYGVVSPEQSRKLMKTLLLKMQQAGYTDFRLGLPGNLVPIRPGDYVDKSRRWGYGAKEDGSDGFQKYENGGATACYTYFTIRALQLLEMHKEADAILYPMLESFKEGGFEGACADGGMTKDWKTWSGECWGYEGFLVDNYLTFLAV